MKLIKCIKSILHKSKWVVDCYNACELNHYKRLYKKNPRLSAEYFYASIHGGVKPDLDNPRNLEEKNIWLALNTDTTIWSLCSDKYDVRNYINEKGSSYLLNDLYGKWDNVEEINFENLPDSFVLKSNDSCGTVIVVTDKSRLDQRSTSKTLKGWLKKSNMGYKGYNGHYLRIKPCIICEKLLRDDLSNGLPIDYKFYCSYGKILFIEVCSGRSVGHHDMSSDTYNEKWEFLDVATNCKYKNIPEPISFEQMKKECNNLAGDFPFCRVDFYEIGGKPVFGELTFTPDVSNFTEDFLREMGDGIALPRI